MLSASTKILRGFISASQVSVLTEILVDVFKCSQYRVIMTMGYTIFSLNFICSSCIQSYGYTNCNASSTN